MFTAYKPTEEECLREKHRQIQTGLETMDFKDSIHMLEDRKRRAYITRIDESEVELVIGDVDEGSALTAKDARWIGEKLIEFADWAEDGDCPYCLEGTTNPWESGCSACDFTGKMTRERAKAVRAMMLDRW